MDKLNALWLAGVGTERQRVVRYPAAAAGTGSTGYNLVYIPLTTGATVVAA